MIPGWVLLLVMAGTLVEALSRRHPVFFPRAFSAAHC